MWLPDGNLIIKQIKAVFSHSHLYMSSNVSTKLHWSLSLRGTFAKTIFENVLSGFGHVVGQISGKTGRERDWNIWYGLHVSDGVIIPYLALRYIISLPPNAWPIMEFPKLLCDKNNVANGVDGVKYVFFEITLFSLYGNCWIELF